jgi:nitroreductase
MLRLLDGSDFELLNEAGDPKLLRRIRSQRRTIFRGYLRSLGRDHARLCAQVRALIVASNTDREDLASALFRMEMTFQRLMLTVHVRLAVHALGIGSVTAAPLMQCFEQVRQHAESLSGTHAVAA